MRTDETEKFIPRKRRQLARAVICRSTVIVIMAWQFAGVSAFADETPRTGIIDDAGVVSVQAKEQINAYLLELEQKTGAQMKVWTILSSKGRDLYSLAIETARKWRLGESGKNNGCLVVIAVKDRKWRTVTGEGIEDVLPDVLSDQIAQAYFVPYFRKGDFSQGILMGSSAMAQSIAKKYNVVLSGATKLAVPTRRGRPQGSNGSACGGSAFFLMVIIVMIISSAARRRRGYYGRWGGGGLLNALMWSSILNSGGRSGGSSWGSSGGFGGGGGGGFGGGGGGSFGGGSGGSW